MKLPSSSSSSKERLFSSLVLLSSILIFVTTFLGKDISYIFRFPQQESQIPRYTTPFAVEETSSVCDLFNGYWVYDEKSRPLYEEHECPYMEEKTTCQAHGRPEKGYQHWRWQPHGCSLPSFNATFMLEKLRGKRMMFAGDSLIRGQFSSMVCLLQRGIPKNAKSFEKPDSTYVFRAKEYNVSIEFYWAPFLLESNCDNFYYHRLADRTVRAGSIDFHAQNWKGVDVLVIQTYIWWMTKLKLKIVKGESLRDNGTMEQMEPEDAYRMGLKELVGWLEENMNPRKSRVFFVTMSAFHSKAWEWGGKRDSSCYNETSPIEDPNYWGSYSSKSAMQIVSEELSASRVPITTLNITQLSEYRKDAHLSIYRPLEGSLKPEQLADPESYADCGHWCVPGVPDTWNELLYTKLFYP